MISHWRMKSQRVIEEAMKRLPIGFTTKDFNRVMTEAYPFGMREMHPYKIWCDEVKKTRDKLFPKDRPPTPFFGGTLT